MRFSAKTYIFLLNITFCHLFFSTFSHIQLMISVSPVHRNNCFGAHIVFSTYECILWILLKGKKFNLFYFSLQVNMSTNPWQVYANFPARWFQLPPQVTPIPWICPSPWLSAFSGRPPNSRLHPAQSRPSSVSSPSSLWMITWSNVSMVRCVMCKGHLPLHQIPHLNLHPNVPVSTQGKRSQQLNTANQTRRSQALKWTTAPLPPAQKTLESMHWVCTTWNHAMRTPAWMMTTSKKRMMSWVPMGTPVPVASGTRMSALYCHRPNQWLRSLRRSRLQFDMPVG